MKPWSAAFWIQLLTLFLMTLQSAVANTHELSLRLQWKHQFEYAGFYAAKELGFYEAAGLDVELLEYENGIDIVSEVSSGQVEFGIWGSGVIERGIQGEPILLLANYFKRSPLALVTRPDIRFPSELEGKRLMASQTDVVSANYAQMFQTFNVDIDQIEFVPPSFSTDEFEAGEVDGVSVFLTNEPYLLTRNGVEYNVIDPNNYGVELYDVNLFSSETFVQNNPVLVDAFIDASNRGWAYALEHPEEIVDLILNKYNTQNKSRDHLIYEAQQTVRMVQPKSYPIGSINKEQVERIANLFVEVGLAERLDSARLIYEPFAPDIDLSDEEQAYLATRPTLSVAMMPDFRPFSFMDRSEARGYEHDLLDLLSQKTGLRFVPQYGIWSQGYEAFRAGEVDMITSISYTEPRTEFTLFTDPYYEIPIMIYVRDDFGPYEGLRSLSGKRIGVLRDVFYLDTLRAESDMELVIYETYEEITRALVLGQIDALMQNLTNIDALIRENAYTNLRLAGELQLPGIKREDLRLGVRSDKPVLHTIVQKGLDAVTTEERFDLAQRWLGTQANSRTTATEFNRPEREYLESKGVIRYCVDPNWMPLEEIDADGVHQGISAEIFDDLVKNTGLNLQLYPTDSWTDTLSAIQDGRCDLISLAMRTPERETYLNFTLPYLSYPFVVATTDHQQFIDNMTLLNGERIAMMRGYAVVELIRNSYPEIEIVEVESIYEGIKMVRSGETYGFIDALPALATFIRTEGMTDIYIAGRLDENFALSVATRKDEPILQNIMQKALTSVTPEKIQEINNRWLAVRFETRVDYTLLYQAFGAFAVIALLGFWRHSVIQRTRKIIEQKNRELEKLAMTDMLTGLFNRHKVDEALLEQLDLSQRYGSSFGVMLMDIDHFKQINDQHGHMVGDTVLKEFSQILLNQTRRSDVVGRWGGEEFLILIPHADKASPVDMAENLRKSVEAHNFSEVERVTVSIGLALHRDNESINELVSRADDALYRSKQQGRNRVSIDS